MAVAQSGQFEALNGLRGIAALVIVQHHAVAWFDGKLLGSGYLAVDFFFLLSGFVLAHAYDRKFDAGMTVWWFMLVRLVRLYPLYALGLLLTTLATLWAGKFDPGRIGLSVFFLPDPHFRWGWLVRGAWSLAFELVANLLFALFHRYLSTAVLLAVSLAGFAALLLCVGAFGTLNIGFRTPTSVGGFARVLFSFPLGVLLYRERARFAGIGTNWAAWPSAIALVLLLAVSVHKTDRGFADLVLVSLALPMLLLFASRAEPAPRSTVVLSLLGLLSYAIYVLHGALLSMFDEAAVALTGHKIAHYGPWLGAIAILAIAALSLAAHFLYDVPVRRALMRWLNTLRQPAAAAGKSG